MMTSTPWRSFALVEIPLISYLVAPDTTRAAVAALHAWIRSRHRRDVATLVAGKGALPVLECIDLLGEVAAVQQ
jgi:hypothetical protein